MTKRAVSIRKRAQMEQDMQDRMQQIYAILKKSPSSITQLNKWIKCTRSNIEVAIRRMRSEAKARIVEYKGCVALYGISPGEDVIRVDLTKLKRYGLPTRVSSDGKKIIADPFALPLEFFKIRSSV